MSDDEDVSPDAAVAVTADELAKIRDAISMRFGAFLRPGESMTIDGTRSRDEAWVKVEIGAVGETFSFELECAALRSDAPPSSEWSVDEAFDDALDLLDANLHEYFENDRFLRLHDDWRIYDFEGANLRFRGRESRPDLEALADEWLAQHGGGNEGDPN